MTRNDELGQLWLHTGAKGDYMTGTISGVRVVCFKNNKEPGSKAPDWRVLLATKRQEGPINQTTSPSHDSDDVAF